MAVDMHTLQSNPISAWPGSGMAEQWQQYTISDFSPKMMQSMGEQPHYSFVGLQQAQHLEQMMQMQHMRQAPLPQQASRDLPSTVETDSLPDSPLLEASVAKGQSRPSSSAISTMASYRPVAAPEVFVCPRHRRGRPRPASCSVASATASLPPRKAADRVRRGGRSSSHKCHYGGLRHPRTAIMLTGVEGLTTSSISSHTPRLPKPLSARAMEANMGGIPGSFVPQQCSDDTHVCPPSASLEDVSAQAPFFGQSLSAFAMEQLTETLPRSDVLRQGSEQLQSWQPTAKLAEVSKQDTAGLKFTSNFWNEASRDCDFSFEAHRGERSHSRGANTPLSADRQFVNGAKREASSQSRLGRTRGSLPVASSFNPRKEWRKATRRFSAPHGADNFTGTGAFTPATARSLAHWMYDDSSEQPFLKETVLTEKTRTTSLLMSIPQNHTHPIGDLVMTSVETGTVEQLPNVSGVSRLGRAHGEGRPFQTPPCGLETSRALQSTDRNPSESRKPYTSQEDRGASSSGVEADELGDGPGYIGYCDGMTLPMLCSPLVRTQ